MDCVDKHLQAFFQRATAPLYRHMPSSEIRVIFLLFQIALFPSAGSQRINGWNSSPTFLETRTTSCSTPLRSFLSRLVRRIAPVRTLRGWKCAWSLCWSCEGLTFDWRMDMIPKDGTVTLKINLSLWKGCCPQLWPYAKVLEVEGPTYYTDINFLAMYAVWISWLMTTASRLSLKYLR